MQPVSRTFYPTRPPSLRSAVDLPFHGSYNSVRGISAVSSDRAGDELAPDRRLSLARGSTLSSLSRGREFAVGVGVPSRARHVVVRDAAAGDELVQAFGIRLVRHRPRIAQSDAPLDR